MKKKKKDIKKSGLIKKLLPLILAGNISIILPFVLFPILTTFVGVVGYNIIMQLEEEEEEEDDSVRLNYATPSECQCILVYDGKQFVNGYDSSILNGSGVSLNSGSTGGTSSGNVTVDKSMSNSKGEYTATGEKIAALARKYIGVSYTNGAHGSDIYDSTWTQGADCSSETYYVLKEAGVLKLDQVPLSGTFQNLGKEVSSWEEMLPGDVICSPNHVTIYIGNGEVWSSGGRNSTPYSHIGGASYYNKGDSHQYITIRRFVDDVTTVSSNSGSNSVSKDLSNMVKQAEKESKRNTISTGSTGNLDSSSNYKNELGKYIDNPDGMPLYDGYTFDSSKVEYYDINYKQFWDGTTPQSDWLYNLGNFADASGTNIVTYEKFGIYDEDGKRIHPYSVAENVSKNGARIEDNRWLMAVPARIYVLDTEVKYWEDIKDKSKYTKIPTWSLGDPPYIAEPSTTIEASNGIYFDVVLDDGSVLPMVSGDAKAMHYGPDPRQSYTTKSGKYIKYGTENFYRSDLSGGYCHMCAKPDGVGNTFSNYCIFEVISDVSNSSGAKTLKNMLAGKKVVSIRVYKGMYRRQADNTVKKWFTDGGTDSSFGLTGGSASGNADWAGTGSVNSNSGSAGGNLTGTNGNLKVNSDGTICMNCTCDGDCKCLHTVSNDGTGGSGSGIGSSGGALTNSGKLEETPGVPQGVYYNWAENRQYTSDEVWNIFQTEAPTLFAAYSPHLGIGMSNPNAVLTQSEAVDVWDDKFGEWPGVIIWLQGGSPYGNLIWHINYSNGAYHDGFECGLKQADFAHSACGLIGCSIAISTMLHRYISPPEILLALACGKRFNNNPINGRYYLCGGKEHSLTSPYSKAIFDNYVYNGKQLFNWVGTSGTFNQTLVDNCLDNGGLVVGTFHQPFSEGSGHYIVITHKDANGLYYTADSNSKHNNPSHAAHYNTGHPFSYLAEKQNYSNNIYITPGPGYAEYINAIKNGANIGSTGTLGSHSEPAGVINLSEDNEYYPYTARDDKGIAFNMSAYKDVSKASNSKGKTVYIDAACGTGIFATSYKERVLPLPDDSPIWKQINQDGSVTKASARQDDKAQGNFTLDIAQRLEKLLLDEGYNVVMGRNSNTATCSDGGSAAIANDTADIAIRIEWDNSGDAGVYTKYFKTGGNNNGALDFSAIASQLKMSNDSSRLAAACTTNLVKQTGLGVKNNGTVDQYTLFLSFSKIPSVVVKCGNINTSDKDVLNNRRGDIASGLRDAVNEYFNQ